MSEVVTGAPSPLVTPVLGADEAELLSRAEQAVAAALRLGASGARASARSGRDVELRLRDGEIEKLQDAGSRGLSVELFVDGRYSSHSTADLRPASVEAFLRDAVALTRALAPDPHRRLPSAAERGAVPSTALDLVDEAVAAGFDKDAAEALLRRSDAVLRRHAQAISATSTWSQSAGTWATVTSDGLAVTERSTNAWLGAEVTLKDAGDSRPEEWDWRGGRQLSALPAPELLAESALQMAVARLGAKKGPSQRTRLIVSPRAAGTLIGHLLRPASAASVQQGKSFLAGKVGQPLFSPQLTLIDDPLVPRGLASRRVDGEGLAAARLPIIEGGVLRALYVDTYYGSKAGLKTTTGSPSNRVFALGNGDLDHHIGQAKRAVLVTSWLGGNSDPTTGDFSLGLRGHLIEDGHLGAPIGEMNVTGNLLSLFAGLSAVGNDPYSWSSTRSPTLVFEDVQLSGA